ncbi:hypothetical protein RDp07_gp26 [Roseobacter phage RD-1410Ws-07]|uniref:Uncharacterized protein n=2 Tax=Sanyabayvirus DS1410Ws06 TaxID=2844087 RepID=A0A191VYP2_9CAUD|nr:hypothetical protein HYO98_gp29 [Dinoroseobacter phage DS-1410Ws-06]ANJ20686.1 hypothetical protein DSp06_gp29 [Dinoroseobacter phage DS-1410Ws-06]ANJ20837.1 hypothetical protein RDp07_gp26 [Roseobacter phage RD-1410Ws-07]
MPDKFLQHDAAGGFREVEGTAVGGAGQANKIPALDLSGRLDSTMMPTGIGAETAALEAFGALSAGDLVNVFNDGGVMKVRRADASTGVAPANGFVLEAYAALATATVYFAGLNSQVTGLTPGLHYLSTTPGASNHVAPAAAGNVVQRIGTALNSTTLFFNPQDPILLA